MAGVKVRVCIPFFYSLGKTKVRQFYVPSVVEQNVLRLEIPVDDHMTCHMTSYDPPISPVDYKLTVEVIHRHDDLGSKEERCGVIKAVCRSEVREQLPSRYILQEHVEEAVIVIGPYPGGGGQTITMATLLQRV